MIPLNFSESFYTDLYICSVSLPPLLLTHVNSVDLVRSFSVGMC